MVQFKVLSLYVPDKVHDCKGLAVSGGTITETMNTYWIKRGRWVFVNISAD